MSELARAAPTRFCHKITPEENEHLYQMLANMSYACKIIDTTELDILIETLTFDFQEYQLHHLEKYEVEELEKNILHLQMVGFQPAEIEAPIPGVPYNPIIFLHQKLNRLIKTGQFQNPDQIRMLHATICQAILPDRPSYN
jgi:hypothetical protein